MEWRPKYKVQNFKLGDIIEENLGDFQFGDEF